VTIDVNNYFDYQTTNPYHKKNKKMSKEFDGISDIARSKQISLEESEQTSELEKSMDMTAELPFVDDSKKKSVISKLSGMREPTLLQSIREVSNSDFEQT